jgi:uroporphyrinogen decarboxylase
MSLKNDRLLRALLRKPVDRTPIWIMRQAGRYLPEYRETRAKAGDFMTLCKTPELACEVTLQPLIRYELDAAILFSDILTIPDAMGLDLHFVEKDIDALGIPDPETDLRYVNDAIRLIHQELQNKIPLIGFAGSPWTLATYMVEGGTSKTFSTIKKMMYQTPELLHQLLKLLADSVALYLNAQIAAGVQAVMLFDTWGGILTPTEYQQFSLHYSQQIIKQLTREHNKQPIPIILFTKNGGQWLEIMAETGCDAVGVDWTTPLASARAQVGQHVALQGNMDPALLYASPDRIHQEVQTILASYGYGSGHVFNLGHGIHPDTPPEHVAALVEAVQMYSPAYHL